MNIKLITAAIILGSAFLMVAPDANSQTRKRVRKSKPATKTVTSATQTQPSESADEAEIGRQLAEIAKLPLEQRTKLGSTIAMLQRVTRKVQLSGFPKYFLSDDLLGESGEVEKAVNVCLAFLPEGLMRQALEGSLQALVDAWMLDYAEKSGTVTNRDLARIEKYKLEGNSLYLMSREVLDLALSRATVAARMMELVVK